LNIATGEKNQRYLYRGPHHHKAVDFYFLFFSQVGFCRPIKKLAPARKNSELRIGREEHQCFHIGRAEKALHSHLRAVDFYFLFYSFRHICASLSQILKLGP
jgi:hypothetical protein